jgi:crossover junction endodeoxyribonuclease RuvC
MRYVGIDPSTKTGLVIFDGDEVLLQEEIIPSEEKDPDRLIEIADKVLGIFKRFGISYTDAICIEGFSFGSKGQGVSIQYGIGWAIRVELVRNGYTYYEIPPTSVKKFATGTGNVKKENMILPIYKRWGFEDDSDNVRDAFVLAKMAQGLKGIVKLTKEQKDALKKVSK